MGIEDEVVAEERGNDLSSSSLEAPSNSSHQPDLPHQEPHIMHSQNMALPPSHHWNASYHNAEPPMDGLRVTALIGIGGFIGWTAAAAYRWLNGGDFTMFPPPATASQNLASRIEDCQHGPAAETEHMISSRHQYTNDSTTWNQRNMLPHGCNGAEACNVRDDILTEQVKALVEALQKQSSENREIVKRLSQQIDAKQTNESMQRLREKSTETVETIRSASNLAIFCKLTEIHSELSSLRRDVRSLPKEGVNEWEERLSTTLANVQDCLGHIKPDAVMDKVSFDGNVTVNSTPVRTIASSWPDPSVAAEPSHESKHAGNQTDRHAVAVALRTLILENDIGSLRVGSQLLYLYAMNLASHPTIPRYRKIFTSNESFKKVSCLKGGREVLHAVGFRDLGNSLVWQPEDEENEEKHLPLLNELAAALGILKSPGQMPAEELLKESLACLSLGLEDTTSSTFEVAPASVHLKTPDPSILSPPMTKKQIRSDVPSVSFTPPLLDSSTASAADKSFFADKDESVGNQALMEPLVDADSVWK